jgi:hypothetical protein
VAIGAIAWNDRRGWYLDAEGDLVVLYRGNPDALLWDSKRVEVLDARLEDLPSLAQRMVRDRETFDTRAAAERVASTTTTTTDRPRRATSTTARQRGTGGAQPGRATSTTRP